MANSLLNLLTPKFCAYQTLPVVISLGGRHMKQRLFAALFAILLAACAALHARPDPEVQKILAPSGKLRVGVYPGSPTSMIRDPASGEIRGVTVDLGTELAKRLGVPVEWVEYRRVEEVLEAMKSGSVDFTVTNPTAARSKDVDFTQPVLAIELGYLVPAGSPVLALTNLDRPSIRVGVTQGSTSQRTLPGQLKHAAVVPAPSLKAAIDMLSQRKLDAFATNKAILFEMSNSLPGSRVLDGRWGLEHMAIGIPKGREQGLAYASRFAADAASEGLVARAAERAGLRGSTKVESQ
jgi:polar amino acid transport system substrate-binding protein